MQTFIALFSVEYDVTKYSAMKILKMGEMNQKPNKYDGPQK